MTDALISPTVAGVTLVATIAAATVCIKKIQHSEDNNVAIPLMGVLGAFVFAVQMINFSIPGTGSSGHLVGALLLAIVLGRYAGFITIMAILLIQALLFGDGGLLAYGCNVLNMGFMACFIGYPLLYKTIISPKQILNRNNNPAKFKRRMFIACLATSIISCQIGAFAVVLETLLSFKSDIPFTYFALAMQSIHLVIGIVEGLITATIVIYLYAEKPEILARAMPANTTAINYKKILGIFSIAALIIGGIISLFASKSPDGLEWSISKTFKLAPQSTPTGFLEFLGKLSIFKNYTIHTTQLGSGTAQSLAAIIGVIVTLLVTAIIGFSITYARKNNKNQSPAAITKNTNIINESNNSDNF